MVQHIAPGYPSELTPGSFGGGKSGDATPVVVSLSPTGLQRWRRTRHLRLASWAPGLFILDAVVPPQSMRTRDALAEEEGV